MATIAARGSSPRRVGPLKVTVRTVLGVGAALWLVPFVVVLLTSLRTEADLASRGVFSVPADFTLATFADAWRIGDFSTVYTNSILVTLIKVPLGLLIASLLAYSLAKLRIRLRGPLLVVILLGLTIPHYIAIIPIFVMMRQLHLIDSIWGLIPPYLAFGIPFEVLVLRAFFKGLPDELLEAGRIDGASELRIFLRIVVPLSAPVLATLFILDAVSTWNELLIALVLLSSDGNRTVPLGILNFSGQFTTNYTGLNAGILIAIAPILIIYVALQKWIVSGLTAGALKG